MIAIVADPATDAVGRTHAGCAAPPVPAAVLALLGLAIVAAGRETGDAPRHGA